MRIKTAIAICTTIVLVLGCAATPPERRLGVADLEVNSVRSAKDMAMCIAETWEGGQFGGTCMRPNANGYTVLVTLVSNVFADVKETPSGSFTRMFGAYGTDGFLNDVKKCASEK
jgi:hypothetical protein